jgi:hypothetical protein
MKNRVLHLLLPLLLLAWTAPSILAVPIARGGFVITKPGKYTLIRNITGKPDAAKTASFGISIQANDVELDLAGYTISPAAGLEGKGAGIALTPGIKRVRVQNGRIHDFYNGVQTSGAGFDDGIFENLQITDSAHNAVDFAGTGLVIRHCVIRGAGARGIFLFTNTGGFNEITDCIIDGGGSADEGVYAATKDGLIVRRCIITGCDAGLSLTTGCKIFDNLTLGCNTAISGNPQMIGINN